MENSGAIGDGRDRVLARKTTGTPGRPAGTKPGAPSRPGTPGASDTPAATGATGKPMPGTGDTPASTGTSPTQAAPAQADTGSDANKAATDNAPKASTPPRAASAAVDLGTTGTSDKTSGRAPGQASDATTGAAGAMPAVKRTPRLGEEAEGETKSATKADATPARTGASDPSAADRSSGDATTARPVPPRSNAQYSDPPEAPSKASSFGAGLLGGLIAAALGLGAGWLWLDQSSRTEAFDTRLGTLEREIAPLSDGLDGLRGETQASLSAIDARLGTTGSGLTEIGTQLEALETRLVEAENSAGPDGTLAREAVARWQAEVDALRADLERQAQEIATMAERAAQEVAAAGRTAEEIEAEAAAVAARARARATLAEIEAALETGEPYPELLEELQATAPADIPAALTGPAAEGVASRAELIEAFPEPARAALATARREGLSGEEGGRVAGFFRDTLQLRSTAPGDGTTTDATLSRAEAALRDGRLTEALSEIDALPEPVREVLSDWITPARTRAEALAAADTLSQSLTEN